jgi:hemin uptake protein HemP
MLPLAMSSQPTEDDADPGPADSPASGDPLPLTYLTQEIFQGRREVWIEHGNEMYRLRITSKGRLILTK